MHAGLRTIATAPRISALARSRELVEPALRAAVESLHPEPRRMAAFSFGWCEADGTPSSGNGGKGVRQALAVLAVEAVGAPVEHAVPAAVAVELIHTFSLIHDDVMDGDERRRHRDAVWKAFGTGPAVLAGDALFALGVRTLSEAGGEHGGRAVGLLAGTLGELVHGQADDLLFETRPWTGPEAVGVAEYRDMAARKTGSLLGCAMALGPALASASPPVVGTFAEAGRLLGIAFQAVDDVLGIWGDPLVTGKPVHSDLRRGKKTLPVLAAMALDGAAAARLARLLGSPGPLSAADAERAAVLVADAGGREFALAEARRQVAAARDRLGAVARVDGAVDEIAELCAYLLERQV
ncbi:polyprenyl synthetase family protein [Streptomyces sp. UNOC14_S4]|uniref:polyprenyl synthetase family protein n=1 Tax=Streptomyces sp. UNOC14_S4 TaxID=2872340 RepID=UPI001E4DF3A3|nr:polyprenyl synthetase family protein [Streptomyces sp. UNOC14_S4]MCC3767626.1 polyprenyl synthetase family protein [Streptomyces sp. UNOC14_S4]